MSYAVRNSLILLVVVALIIGGGWSYLHFVQEESIKKIETELNGQKKQLREKQQIASQYSLVLDKYEQAKNFYENYNKALYLSSDEDRVFDFINRINTGNAFTDFNFAFKDSAAKGDYGIITTDINGEGYYRYFVNLVRKIEYSKPLNKIKNVSVTPINTLEDYGRVNFSFTLESYYERKKLLAKPTFDVYKETLSSLYNPFYPLIRDIKPNTDNLINIEKSNLLSLSGNRVFLIDQDGIMQELSVGDKVYLGTLKNINLKKRSATFELNKGGITELVTLEVTQ